MVNIVSALSNQWIDIFRAGDHGAKGSFTQADVQQIVDNYKPEFHEAPAVVGHPVNDAPAFGWWEKVRRVGDVLQGKLKDDVNPAFEEAVRARKFPKRSVSLYKGSQGYSLRHVGFLGAMPPEVKGLADVKFGEEDQKAIEIEFSEEIGMADATQIDDKQLGERMTAFFENLFGKKAATSTFSEAQVKEIATQAVAAAVTPLQAQLDAQKLQFSEREKTLSTAESQARADAAIARVKSKGAWVPAFDKAGLPLIFADLATETVTIEFGEGDKKAQKTKLEIFTNFMEELKAIVPVAPVYIGQTVAPGPTAAAKAAGVNDTYRAPADPNSLQFDQLIKARSAEKSISYGDAMNQIAAEKPELTRPGGIATGAV